VWRHRPRMAFLKSVPTDVDAMLDWSLPFLAPLLLPPRHSFLFVLFNIYFVFVRTSISLLDCVH